MEDKFDFSFDDEVANKFCYDMENKKIEIYFSGYTDCLKKERLLDAPCVFIIQNWSKAKCRIADEKYHMISI